MIDSLVIRWPSGQVDTYDGVAANQVYKATEGDGLAQFPEDPAPPPPPPPPPPAGNGGGNSSGGGAAGMPLILLMLSVTALRRQKSRR